MNPISKEEALRLGLRKYYTGIPCIRGHLAERYTSCDKCIDCSRADSAKRYIANGKYHTAYTHEYYVANRDRILAKQKRYRDRKRKQKEEQKS